MNKMLQSISLGLLTLTLPACTPAAAVTQVRQDANQAKQTLISHLPGTLQSRLPGAPDPATISAIQFVITRGDLEQEQAIARRDSTLMKDTSTDSYYQQVAQTNQDLLDGGVTAIKLVNVVWGSITVNGNTARAENRETWSTTYDDGSTDQSTDRNVYTLVQQNGAWKIQADDQPDGGEPAPQPRNSAAPRPSSRPAGSAQAAPSGASLSIGGQAGTPEAAVQDVILRGNHEQEQAISSHDSTVMKDTSTDGYYQDLAQTNQDMLDNGVISIKLLGIEWGDTKVNGNTATVSTYETWTSSYSD
ncbi:MAG TPA: hypothetical protein VF157_11195, partial [Chloroflexota bacterium]